MIARDIIVTFCNFSELKYARIFGINLGHDTYRVKKSPWPSTLCVCVCVYVVGVSVPGLAPEIYISIHFL